MAILQREVLERCQQGPELYGPSPLCRRRSFDRRACGPRYLNGISYQLPEFRGVLAPTSQVGGGTLHTRSKTFSHRRYTLHTCYKQPTGKSGIVTWLRSSQLGLITGIKTPTAAHATLGSSIKPHKAWPQSQERFLAAMFLHNYAILITLLYED